jgi:hypothetical protein
MGKDAASRMLDLVAAIADAIAGVTLGLPVVVISVLIVKEGLYTMCERHWR